MARDIRYAGWNELQMKTMMMVRAMLALAPAAAGADLVEPEPPRVIVSAPQDSEWHRYRRAYQTTMAFARHTATRPLIQVHMQIRPLHPDLPMEGLHIQLLGAKTNVGIPVDAIGRATVPLIKAAYDEDAVMRLNRQKGHYIFSGRYSIREREDGKYPATQLHAACEQLLSAQRESGYRLRLLGKRCAGIKFVYRLSDPDPRVVYVDASGAERVLPVTQGYPFENATMGTYKVALYRLADRPASGTVVTQTRPIAIGTLYE